MRRVENRQQCKQRTCGVSVFVCVYVCVSDTHLYIRLVDGDLVLQYGSYKTESSKDGISVPLKPTQCNHNTKPQNAVLSVLITMLSHSECTTHRRRTRCSLQTLLSEPAQKTTAARSSQITPRDPGEVRGQEELTLRAFNYFQNIPQVCCFLRTGWLHTARKGQTKGREGRGWRGQSQREKPNLCET